MLSIFIAIEYYINNKLKAENQNDLLNDIQIDDTDEDTTISKPYESEEVLLNPGKGFVLRDSLDNSCDNVISTVYFRFGWNDIEPEEGNYNWSIIDNKLNNCIKRGKKFAFGVMNSCISSREKYVTPKWVFDAGAKYTTCENSIDGGEQIIPVWTDDIYLQKLYDFIDALANRYDGNENIAFIDIRSYGSYGEQHLYKLGGQEISPDELKKLYIEYKARVLCHEK